MKDVIFIFFMRLATMDINEYIFICRFVLYTYKQKVVGKSRICSILREFYSLSEKSIA